MPATSQTTASPIHPHQIPTLQAAADPIFERAFAQYLANAPQDIREAVLTQNQPVPSHEAKQSTQTTEAAKPEPQQPSQQEASNPSVNRCRHAYNQALRAALKNGKSQYSATTDAEKAYCAAMPPLSGSENIRDFIACVAQAMLIGAILGPDGARLLYAAQVAYQASAEPKPNPTRGPGRPRNTPAAPETPIPENN
jgi:hypothetical protein